MLITDSKGRTFSLYDETLADDMRAIDAEAARREGRPPKTNGFMVIDLRAHPDLLEKEDKTHEAAAARQRARPPLSVKPGDWVRINGYRFLVASINPEARIITTERYDTAGRFVSSVPCHGPDASLLRHTRDRAPGRRPPSTRPARSRAGSRRRRLARPRGAG